MNERAPAPAEEGAEGPGIRPSLVLVLFTWLAESIWAYTILGFVVAYVTPEADFGPLFVAVPYALAAVTTIALAALWGVASRFANRHSAKSLRVAYLSVPLPYLIMYLAATVVGLLYVIGFLLALLGVSWWEMYSGWGLLDPRWLERLLVDTDGGNDRATALAWLWGLGILIWWRGSYATRARVDASGTISRFLLGTVFLIAMVVWAGISSVGQIAVSVLLAGFMLFGLAGVAAARLDGTAEGREGGLDPGWRWRSLLLSGLLVALGFGVILVAIPLLSGLATWIWHWLIDVIVPALLAFLGWLVHLLGLDQPPEVAVPPPGEPVNNPPPMQEPPLTLPEWLSRAARLLFNLSWMAIVLYALYLAMRRQFWKPSAWAGGASSRERVPWSLRSWLVSVLLAVLRLLASRWPSLTHWISRLAAQEEGGWTVRKVYRRLLAWGEGHGSVREAWITPREYEAALAGRWPALSEDFRAVTSSYLRVRYGGIAATEEELEAVLRGWVRIEAAGHEGQPRKHGDTRDSG